MALTAAATILAAMAVSFPGLVKAVVIGAMMDFDGVELVSAIRAAAAEETLARVEANSSPPLLSAAALLWHSCCWSLGIREDEEQDLPVAPSVPRSRDDLGLFIRLLNTLRWWWWWWLL